MKVLRPIRMCRACGSPNLTKFLDLGKQYISDFREDKSKPPAYPLVVVFCESCKLVQLKHTVPQNEMYHARYGFKSGVNEKIRQDLDDNVTHAFQYVNDPETWLDIASNDGTLLSFVPENIYRVGVDPVKFLCEEAKQHADLIINDYFSANSWMAGVYTFDVITSISCFYDMPSPEQFVYDVMLSLADKGVWVIQQNYLLTTLMFNAVDNFCHEHLEYYTLLSLENLLDRFGLEVNEVKVSMVNGGSIRTIVSHKGTFPIHPSVDHQRDIEDSWWLGNIEPYRRFAEDINERIEKLQILLLTLKAEGKSIAILAASTRGATIWQTAGIDRSIVDYAVERNQAKVGKMFSAIGIPIISEEEAHKRMPDYMIVGPWWFADQIIKREKGYLKAGGKLIIPLPNLEVIDGGA